MFVNKNIASIQKASLKFAKATRLSVFYATPLSSAKPDNFDFGFVWNTQDEELQLIYLHSDLFDGESYSQFDSCQYFEFKDYLSPCLKVLAFHMGLVLPKQRHGLIRPLVWQAYRRLKDRFNCYDCEPGSGSSKCFHRASISFAELFEIAESFCHSHAEKA